eukprot:1156529-Alexandrium_andersonii.AAC.1
MAAAGTRAARRKERTYFGRGRLRSPPKRGGRSRGRNSANGGTPRIRPPRRLAQWPNPPVIPAMGRICLLYTSPSPRD